MKDGSSLESPETQTSPSPPVPKDGQTITVGSNAECEANELKSQASLSVSEPSPSCRAPPSVNRGTRIPSLCLRSVYAPENGYKCDQCQQLFTVASQLVKHKQLHEKEEEEEKLLVCEICGNVFTSQAGFAQHKHDEEPSFPCNVCDRSFTTIQCLKRHKLLHVKDGRKCGTCGVLFCQLHNHVLFQPQPTPTSPPPSPSPSPPTPTPTSPPPPEQGSPVTESPLEPDPHSSSDLDDQPPPPKPLPKIHNPLPPVSHMRVRSDVPTPVRVTPRFCPRLRRPVPKYSRKAAGAGQPVLPPSLKIFSPQYLTSAFLDVNRNYEYIFSKPIDVKDEDNIVKEEPRKLPVPAPCEPSVEIKKEENCRIAYDVEIVL